MKKNLLVLTLLAFAMLFITANADAQILTRKGDFFHISRTVEQTADSVTFIADTLTVTDNEINGNGVANFIDGDSVCVMFVQNRFKIVNNKLGSNLFDYVIATPTYSTGMYLSKKAYNGVPPGGFDVAENSTDAGSNGVIHLRPVYRPIGNIASTSNFNQGPTFPITGLPVYRQVLTFIMHNPTAGRDGWSLRRIYFKPNINNLMGLATPPDTTKDTLRAYLLDGPTGNVVNYTDLAIVRLLPGTTQILTWVGDSAQAADVGEYIGSFGDYSRGRYFLGDDGLPMVSSVTPEFRPGAINPVTGGPNPDYGLVVDGFPPESNPIRNSNLYYALAPGGGGLAPLTGYTCSPPNPQYGLIPPYRCDAVNYPGLDNHFYLPALVTSGVDTLRFLDTYGNRTWDRATQPKLTAIQWNQNATGWGTPIDRTVYLKGYTDRDDTLRQIGQMVYRKLSYTHADLDPNAGQPLDSVQIVASATVIFRGQGGIQSSLVAWQDTTGGYPRKGGNNIRQYESNTDDMARIQTSDDNGHSGMVVFEPNRDPIDPFGLYGGPFLPPTGLKLVFHPNIPRRLNILPLDKLTGQVITSFVPPNSYTVGIDVKLTATDGFGNVVDDNERFKYEISPFSQRLQGVFDSAGHGPGDPVFPHPGPNDYWPGPDSGSVSTGASFPAGQGFGNALRGFRAASGSNNLGQYRIRARVTYGFPDHSNDLYYPYRRDLNPGPGFGPMFFPDIPHGSPNNTFGVVFQINGAPVKPVGCGDAGFGDRMGQTVAIDSIEVGPQVILNNKFLELVSNDETFIVNMYGNRVHDPIKTLYARATDVWNNPVDLNLSELSLTLPDNPSGMSGDKDFRSSVSPNVAEGGLGGVNCPVPTFLYDAVQVNVALGQRLGDADGNPIIGDYPAMGPYKAIRWFFLAPKNIARTNVTGTAEVLVVGKLTTAFGNRGYSSILIKVMADVVQTVEIFRSNGKPTGSTEPVPWMGGSTVDREAMWFPTGTPTTSAESEEFYTGYFFRASDGTKEASTGVNFPTPEEAGATIGAFGARALGSDDDDATAPIPMDTVTVSTHTKQIRIVARVLDQYRNPVGGRLVKFWTLGQTIPITPPRTVVQDNAQRGGFGEFGSLFISDDTLKRSTVGDTAQAGWVSAYFNSGRVGWQIVRIALTPDTLAYDFAPYLGRNLGEGTIAGVSRRGFAPRVVIPIYQKSDTVVTVKLYPYTAAPTSPVPLPHDPITIQRYEHPQLYDYPCTGPQAGNPCKDNPLYVAWSSVASRTEVRRVVAGRFTGADIRPYIPDTLGLTATTGPNAITAGRIVTILAREYDQFGNLCDFTPIGTDTARVRFRMWGEPNPGAAWGDPPPPYHLVAGDPQGGTIAPTAHWTQDEWGPMRKARYRHTQISVLVAGIHINQTAFVVGLEYPTPKLQDATVFFECTASGVLPPSIGPTPDIDRDTVKIVSVVKNPTRFDILRAGQDWAVSGSLVGTVNLTGTDDRQIDQTIVGLPFGADPFLHNYDAWGVDNILVSQVYTRNTSQELVGLYEIVNNDNVPIDKQGNPMFLATGAVNPAFQGVVKLPAFNSQNPSYSPFYNALNNPALQQRILNTTINGARDDGTIFDVSIAGGGDGIGANIGDSQNGFDSRRPVAFRVTPVWENTTPMGPSNMTIEGRPYGRMYADSIYTYGGRIDANADGAKGEFMGTRTDRGNPQNYMPSGEKDRITRLATGLWPTGLFNAVGFPNMSWAATSRVNPNPLPAGTPTIYASIKGTGGDFNRRIVELGKGFSRGTLAPGYIAPGAFFALADSTTEQVIDLRVYDKSLVDGVGNVVDDTISYDQGKNTIVRTASNGLRQYGDTYFTGITGIQGPNANSTAVSDVRTRAWNELDPSVGLEPLVTRQFPGGIYPNPTRHTFVMIPYRIAFTSIFPSSFDVSSGLRDFTRLPLGLLARQCDIDTLPRVLLIPPPGTDLTKFELFTRLYGQIQHGATAQIPLTNPNEVSPYNATPYARPDTVYRDLIYTYAVTPYDRYGNLNTRDTLFVNVGARFSDWDFLDLGTGAGANLAIRAGGQYFRAIPRNTPTNEQYRHDTLRLFNPRGVTGSNRNDFLGVKPDDDEVSITVGRAKTPFGTGEAMFVPHGLLPANIIASRPVDVKLAFAPAPFTLNTSTIRNTDLFRIDYTGCNVPNEYAKDTLRLFWQTSVWPPASGKNNPNDTTRYYWHAIVDSVYTGGGTTNPLDVRIKADNDGVSPSLTIDGLTLRNLLFRPTVQPQPNGNDSLVMRVRWYVEATNKASLTTYSDTAGGTVRQFTPGAPPTLPLVVSINRRPVCASGLAPANNYPTPINATSTINATWNPGADINITKGNLIGGFKVFDQASQKWITDASGRTVDTLSYQWRGVVRRTFPVGKGAPIGYQVIVPAGVNAAGVVIPSNVLDDLFRGFSADPTSTSADSVILDWYVDVKDFNFTNGKEAVTFDSAWSGVGCRPHICTAGPTRLNLTKLDQGGIVIDPAAAAADINKLTGEQACFTLTAKDANGNIIRDWDVKGSDVTLSLANSTANTDSSDATHTMQNGDPNSFTEAYILDKNGARIQLKTGQANQWILPKGFFVNGVTTICFVDTKAESALVITATPASPITPPSNVSAKMNFETNGITNYLLQITGQSPLGINGNQVYVMRRYEVTVYPRDKYSNFSNKEIITAFTARFPGEFDNTNLGSADIFSGNLFIKGPTNYFILSTTKREKPADQLQTITAFKVTDNSIRGTTDPYEILTHAPSQFSLQLPADLTEIKLMKSADINTFTWTKSTDPYSNIHISKFDPPTAVFSDKIVYKWIGLDAPSLASKMEFVSDGNGATESLTMTSGQLLGVINGISGNPTTKSQDIVWKVEATDGLFTTLSTPPNADPANRPGFRLKLTKEGILDVPTTTVPTEYALSQNYPNPFNPSTQISFSLPKASRVTLMVYDLLGQPVKTLVNDYKEAGSYSIEWDATNDLNAAVPTGTYVYKIIAGDFSATRKMTLLK